MEKRTVKTSGAPEAIGPYSQAVKLKDLIFTSGQIPIDPANGQFMDGSVEDQTKLVMSNIKAVLEAAGSGFNKVLKTTVYLKSMDDFKAMNAVYAEFFPENPPARATVEVARLPKDSKVEIECIAYSG
jgi:2-iminobutanoate/2-iminopropanoate deaminase